MTDPNKQLVQDFIQALFTRGDLTAVEHHLTPDFVDHDPTIPGHAGDRESMRDAAIMMRAAFPDWHSTVLDLIAEGDKVVERFVASGTHLGPLGDVPPSGQTASLAGINVFRVEGGRIAERWGVLDQQGFWQQVEAGARAATAR